MLRIGILSSLVVLFTACATAIMIYVALAVPVGPWIDPTLALIACGVVLCVRRIAQRDFSRDMVLVVSAAGLGGIIATALAWSVPTVLFVDRVQFDLWMAQPMLFMTTIVPLVIVAGLLGYAVVHARYEYARRDPRVLFPIGRLVERTVTAPDDRYQMSQLSCGALAGLLFHTAAQAWWPGVRALALWGQCWMGLWRIPALSLGIDFIPMVWAIGSITGGVVAVPFAVGAALKYIVLEPLCRAGLLGEGGEMACLLAVVSGLVLQGVVSGFYHSGYRLVRMIRAQGVQSFVHKFSAMRLLGQVGLLGRLVLVGLLPASAWCFQELGTSWMGVLYIIVATAICAYQLMLFMGRVGLAPLGRFALFVMMPGMLIFGWTPLQAILVAAFVEVAGGVAAVGASGRAALGEHALLAEVRLLSMLQLLAIGVAAVVGAGVFWVLSVKIGLGGAGLVAQRAQTRALIMQAAQLPCGGLMVGALLGFVLHAIGVNTTLVLGGILMALDWSLVLIVSGLLVRLFPRIEQWHPFWGGLFATSSLWVVLRALIL